MIDKVEQPEPQDEDNASISLIDLPPDWLEQYGMRRISRRISARAAQLRKRWLREQNANGQ